MVTLFQGLLKFTQMEIQLNKCDFADSGKIFDTNRSGIEKWNDLAPLENPVAFLSVL
jgi:hypothetical protein